MASKFPDRKDFYFAYLTKIGKGDALYYFSYLKIKYSLYDYDYVSALQINERQTIHICP